MSKVYILEADPTRCGGIQQFVRNLASYLPANKVELLAYYGDLSEEKTVPVRVVKLNDYSKRSLVGKIFGSWKGAYLSFSDTVRNISLLMDLLRIRSSLDKLLPGGDVLILNSPSAMLLFCTRRVLKNNRVVLVQHTAPRIMYSLDYYFGGIFRKKKLALFEKYVDAFVALSEFDLQELSRYLPLNDKKCRVIRHAMSFPAALPESAPAAVAVLSRLVPLKCVDRVIEAAGLLPNVVFNIYGDGPEKQRLKKMAENYPNVVFHGFTNDIDGVFNQNSVLLITSEYEGYPVCGGEACTYGRPIVVLNTFPAASDLVHNQVNGLVLDDFSPRALADAIAAIIENIDTYRKGALEHRKLYDVQTAVTAWRDLLGDV